MMVMDFSFQDYQTTVKEYPETYTLYNSIDKKTYKLLEEKQRSQEANANRALDELKRRTTDEYFQKVFAAQLKALTYSKKVFPTYNFIMPDALADDWLSTMDWHKKYPTRDHSLHQTLAAYIVSKLLGFGDPSKGLMLTAEESLLARCAKLLIGGGKMSYIQSFLRKNDQEYDKHKSEYDFNWAVEVFYETAIISALFHDMGYPWQFVNNLASSIAPASYEKITGMIRNIDATFDSIKESLLILPFFGYDESHVKLMLEDKKAAALKLIENGVRKTHGMPGALSFMCLNENSRKYQGDNPIAEATFKLIMDWASVGIMMHDMPGIYWTEEGKKDGIPKNSILRLDFETDPLSCLISIADILEEFERPYAIFPKEQESKSDYVPIKYAFCCNGSQIAIDAGHLSITYFYNDEEERSKNNDRRVEEVKQYLDLKTGYINLSSWGITSIEGKTAVLGD